MAQAAPPTASPPAPATVPGRLSLPSLENRAAIAVLPFANIGEDPAKAYLARGIAEDILLTLTRLDGLLVIAPNTTSRYEGKADAARLVRKELGIRYALEGRVGVDLERIRLTVRLTDGEQASPPWEESFDRPRGDVFAIQGEIVRQVVSKLVAGARKADIDRALPKPAAKFEAYDLTLRARELHNRFDKSAMTEARRLALRAVDADPFYAPSYVWLGRIHHQFATHRSSPEHGLVGGLVQEEQLAARAIDIDPSYAMAHIVRASALSLLGKHDEALAEAERAVELNPNDHYVLAIARGHFGFYGFHDRSIELQTRAMRLDPHYTAESAFTMGGLYDAVGDRAKAVDAFRDCQGRDSSHQDCLINLASLHAQLDQMDEARQAVAELRRLNHGFTIGEYRNESSVYGSPEDEERMAAGLHKAGVSE